MQAKQITVQATVNAPMQKVWAAWNEPEHITHWAFASNDWKCPKAENDLQVGGKLATTMAAKDGSASFVYGGTYNEIIPHKLIDMTMDEVGRNVHTEFIDNGDSVTVVESFDPENENSEEMQRQGWQAILDNFKSYVETV